MAEIVLGFSGGVDSSASALILMDAGFKVRGVYLDTGGASAPESALAAAKAMGFSCAVIDARREMEELVCRPFAESYLRGETPIPCVCCNREVKLRLLCDYADSIGAAGIATGHYIRTDKGAVYKGAPENDQSYMLCRITRRQAEMLTAPLGGMNKKQVRAFAASRGIPAASKPDSMEICFIPDNDYAGWIDARGSAPPPGELIYGGRVVGHHAGIHHYTLGQRRGLGFAAGRRVYVSAIRPEENAVELSDGDGLYAASVRAGEVSWLTEPPQSPLRCSLRVRHSRQCYPALLTPTEGGFTAVFDEPVRAPTPGQAAAVYDGDRLLGGGIII